MSKLLIFLSMLLVMMMVNKGEAQGAEAAAESPVDYMESERVMADPGKDAFNGMEAAVNNAAESVKGLGGELEQAINQAVSFMIRIIQQHHIFILFRRRRHFS